MYRQIGFQHWYAELQSIIQYLDTSTRSAWCHHSLDSETLNYQSASGSWSLDTQFYAHWKYSMLWLQKHHMWVVAGTVRRHIHVSSKFSFCMFMCITSLMYLIMFCTECCVLYMVETREMRTLFCRRCPAKCSLASSYSYLNHKYVARACIRCRPLYYSSTIKLIT